MVAKISNTLSDYIFFIVNSKKEIVEELLSLVIIFCNIFSNI